MFRKPSPQLQLPLLALLFLSLIISIATLVCAATTLRLFDSQQGTNPWLLPIWRNHFDLRGLKLVVGTSAVVALFDLIAFVALVVLAAQVSLRLFTEDSTPTYIPVLDTNDDPLITAPRGTVQHRAPDISHDKSPLSLSRPPSCYSPSRPQRSCTRKGHNAKLDLRLGLTGTEHPRWDAGGFWQSLCLDRHIVLGEQCPDSIHISSTTSTLPDKTTANRYVSQRFATYAPLATLFLHLALLALSLAAYQKAKSSSSARAATPNSEDGEKLELEEYKNFPKDDKA
ncbi:hypothetical protein Q7P35_001484 [Cladosporium inversicolor]